MTIPKCQKCDQPLQVVDRWYHYSTIQDDPVESPGVIIVGDVEDVVPDENFDRHLYCNNCEERRSDDGGGPSKWDVELALLFSEPQSYELHYFVVEAFDEDDAAKQGEIALEDYVEKSEGNTHNIAGIHLWGAREHEPEMEEPEGELPAEG